MPSDNLKRMMRLAEEVFAVKNDPDQLDVNQDVIERLHRIHPSTVSEYNEGDGPIAWLLVIPTTLELMFRFLRLEATEKELFRLTPLDAQYESIYLCSALVLDEHRRKGIIKDLALTAIESILKDHPIQCLFTWPFTAAGELASEKIAQLTGLPLYKRDLRQ